MAKQSLPNFNQSLKICVTCQQEFFTLPNKWQQRYCSITCRTSIRPGDVFNQLTAKSVTDGRTVNGSRVWVCECSCGNHISVSSAGLKRGVPRTCGCEWHGMSKTPTYRIWGTMRARCNNPKNTKYHDYGERGIKVCKRWESFENFLADMGERPDGMSIERKDNDGNYEPDNCKWATRVEQQNNRRNSVRIVFEGVSLTLTQWARLLGIKPSILANRLKRGYSFVEAVTNRNVSMFRRNKEQV